MTNRRNITTERAILEGIRRACDKAGGQLKLAQRSGLSQGQLSDYLCGRRKIRNMTIGTLKKLFPELCMQFWDTESHDQLDPVEQQIRALILSMPTDEKAHCLKLLAANFAHRVLAENGNSR